MAFLPDIQVSFSIPKTEGFMQLAKDYQVLIGVFAGIITVLLTMLANDWVGRRARYSAIQHERSTLRTALLSELLFLDTRYKNIVKVLSATDLNSMNMIPYEPDHIYKTMTKKLGLLEPKEISLLIEAYGHSRSVIDTTKSENELTDAGTVRIRRENFAGTIEMLNKGTEHVQNAIAGIRSCL
jgi:hypothetical protein